VRDFPSAVSSFLVLLRDCRRRRRIQICVKRSASSYIIVVVRHTHTHTHTFIFPKPSHRVSPSPKQPSAAQLAADGGNPGLLAPPSGPDKNGHRTDNRVELYRTSSASFPHSLPPSFLPSFISSALTATMTERRALRVLFIFIYFRGGDSLTTTKVLGEITCGVCHESAIASSFMFMDGRPRCKGVSEPRLSLKVIRE